MNFRIARYGLGALAAVLLLVVVIASGLLIGLNAGLFRSPFVRFVSWRAGRPIEVRGALHVHLLARSPSVEAERVTIGNPRWSPPGVMAELDLITVGFGPVLSHESGLRVLKIAGAQLHFTRDEGGRANWQRYDPAEPAAGALPLLRALTLSRAHLTLVDERLHLNFQGEISVDSVDSLQIRGSGTLNERAVSFHLQGDALTSALPEKPYAFEFDERSSGAHLTAHGSLPRPFDLGQVDAQLDAGGADLRDLYYLAGLRLPNTGVFQLQGRMQRRDAQTLFEDLQVKSGESDVRGRVSLDTGQGRRTQVRLELSSALLRTVDVGPRAAGRVPHPDAPPQLFSDVPLVTAAARRVDVVGKYSAQRLLLARLEVTELSAPFTIQQGHIQAHEITARVLGGHVALKLDADANQTPARAKIDLTLSGAQLGRIPHKSEPPPFEGPLDLAVHVQGVGDSLHAVASDAQGTLSARVAQGTLRASLAELAGVDLRGLGLTLSGSSREAPMRCAAADFAIHDGVMRSSRLFIDSEPVFISGAGQVQLDSETLDLELRGDPKHTRILRLKAPLLVQGTLLQPKFSVDVANSGLRLVDRGTPQHADCAR